MDAKSPPDFFLVVEALELPALAASVELGDPEPPGLPEGPAPVSVEGPEGPGALPGAEVGAGVGGGVGGGVGATRAGFEAVTVPVTGTLCCVRAVTTDCGNTAATVDWSFVASAWELAATATVTV